MESINHLLAIKGYDLIKQIGEGGFSSCYLVVSSKYNEKFVAKITNRNNPALEEIKAFKNETESLIRLSHPNIINIFEHFSTEQYHVMILEYCPYGSIADLLKEEGKIRGHLLIKYTKEIIKALEYVHSKGFVHHDIKPSNILIDKNHRIKLADFGLATYYDNNVSTLYSGSPFYLAPEVIKKTPYDPFKADIWALGVSIYQMATGTLPFYSKSKSTLYAIIGNGCYRIPRDIDPSILAIIIECIRIDISSRKTAEDLSKHKVFMELSSGMKRVGNSTCLPVFRQILPSMKSSIFRTSAPSKIIRPNLK